VLSASRVVRQDKGASISEFLISTIDFRRIVDPWRLSSNIYDDNPTRVDNIRRFSISYFALASRMTTFAQDPQRL
jgi:hypothetical protein